MKKLLISLSALAMLVSFIPALPVHAGAGGTSFSIGEKGSGYITIKVKSEIYTSRQYSMYFSDIKKYGPGDHSPAENVVELHIKSVGEQVDDTLYSFAEPRVYTLKPDSTESTKARLFVQVVVEGELSENEEQVVFLQSVFNKFETFDIPPFPLQTATGGTRFTTGESSDPGYAIVKANADVKTNKKYSMYFTNLRSSDPGKYVVELHVRSASTLSSDIILSQADSRMYALKPDESGVTATLIVTTVFEGEDFINNQAEMTLLRSIFDKTESFKINPFPSTTSAPILDDENESGAIDQNLTIEIRKIRYVRMKVRGQENTYTKKYIVYVAVKNTGNNDITKQFNFKYAVGQLLPSTYQYLPKLGAKQEKIIKIYLPPQARGLGASFSVDSENIVKETNERDNSQSTLIKTNFSIIR